MSRNPTNDAGHVSQAPTWCCGFVGMLPSATTGSFSLPQSYTEVETIVLARRLVGALQHGIRGGVHRLKRYLVPFGTAQNERLSLPVLGLPYRRMAAEPDSQ